MLSSPLTHQGSDGPRLAWSALGCPWTPSSFSMVALVRRAPMVQTRPPPPPRGTEEEGALLQGIHERAIAPPRAPPSQSEADRHCASPHQACLRHAQSLRGPLHARPASPHLPQKRARRPHPSENNAQFSWRYRCRPENQAPRPSQVRMDPIRWQENPLLFAGAPWVPLERQCLPMTSRFLPPPGSSA